ncbi:MAG: hypothetical protein LBR34_06980, partial [Prevotella sp.]|nr:hypothetical protein [Prevotella sp.]
MSKSCPKCQTENRTDATSCRICHFSFDGIDEEPLSEEEILRKKLNEQAEENKLLKEALEKTKEKDIKAPTPRPVQPITYQPQPENESSKTSKRKWIVFVVIIGLIVGFAGFNLIKIPENKLGEAERPAFQISQEILEGNYTVKWKAGEKQLKTFQAEIKATNRQNEYQISIYGDTEPKQCLFELDGDYLSSSDSEIGRGQV